MIAPTIPVNNTLKYGGFLNYITTPELIDDITRFIYAGSAALFSWLTSQSSTVFADVYAESDIVKENNNVYHSGGGGLWGAMYV